MNGGRWYPCVCVEHDASHAVNIHFDCELQGEESHPVQLWLWARGADMTGGSWLPQNVLAINAHSHQAASIWRFPNVMPMKWVCTVRVRAGVKKMFA